MAAGEVAGSEFQARAGALTLLYLASPMEREVLHTLLAEVNTGVELQQIEPPSEEFLTPSEEFLKMGIFEDPYLLEPADPDHDPDEPIGPDTMLQPTAAGRELVFVGAALERWLRRRPAGPLKLGPEAGEVLGPLLASWASMVIHAFAAGPITPEEAAEALQIVELDVVEARVEAMEEVGLLREAPGADGERRFEPTDWLRRAVAPLAAAAHLELRHPPGDTAPIAALDVEAAFMLALPLSKLPRKLSGTCSLSVELDEGVLGSPASVTARIEGRRVVSVVPGREEDADAWAAGTAGAWLDAVIDRDASGIETGGDERLAGSLLKALNRKLF